MGSHHLEVSDVMQEIHLCCCCAYMCGARVCLQWTVIVSIHETQLLWFFVATAAHCETWHLNNNYYVVSKDTGPTVGSNSLPLATVLSQQQLKSNYRLVYT